MTQYLSLPHPQTSFHSQSYRLARDIAKGQSICQKNCWIIFCVPHHARIDDGQQDEQNLSRVFISNV